MQQKPQVGWQWFLHTSRPMQVGISVSVLVVTCCLCAGLGATLNKGGTTTSSTRVENQATKVPKPITTYKPTATTQTEPYPPKTQADLRTLASLGDASAIHEFHAESVGLTGVCPIPKRVITVDPSVTGRQFAEDLLAYFYDQQLDSPCGSIVFAYHKQSEDGDVYTAGRINFDATDSSGQANIDPNATNLKFTLTLDIGDGLSPQEYVVNY